MAALWELIAGDEVRSAGTAGTFITYTDHPIWPGLRLVVWWLPEEERWSHDALHPHQDVGERVTATDEDRMRRLRTALLGTGEGDRG